VYKCPNCNENGITLSQKLKSGSLNPAICKICSEKSYIHAKYGMYPIVVTSILALPLWLLVIKYGSMVFILVAIPIFVVCTKVFILNTPLSPLTKQ
jgi:hypothetical protein